jgi:lipopolysaccharide/colanic/teichoic acid biosynthesis glycosyltransferase
MFASGSKADRFRVSALADWQQFPQSTIDIHFMLLLLLIATPCLLAVVCVQFLSRPSAVPHTTLHAADSPFTVPVAHLHAMLVRCMRPTRRWNADHMMTEVHKHIHAVPVPQPVLPAASSTSQ